MATSPKKPRRTAERILEVTLDLFNRFGEPNVSTTLISAELGISPGNLYYHYPAKDELINALFGRYENELAELLAAGISRAADHGAAVVWANARDASLDFYRRNGMVEVGEGFIEPVTGLPHHRVVTLLN